MQTRFDPPHWKCPQHILAWAWHPSHQDAFYLYRDGSQDVEVVGKGVMTLNGYLSFRRGMDSERHLSIADDSSCISTMWPVANGQSSVPIIHRLHTEAHGTVTCTRQSQWQSGYH